MDLFYIAQVPAGDGPHPTVVLLHGWGANAHDLFGLAPAIHGGEALVLSPQGPIEMQVGPGATGYGWFPITSDAPPDPASFAIAAAQLRAFLDAAEERYPIDPNRVVLLGFSQGGVMAYELALREPERFAALVALSSWLPEPVAARAERSPALEKLPVLVIHGTSDPMIPVERARESLAHLEALGIPAAHGEYEMGHEINPQSLRDAVGWLEQTVFAPA